MKKFIALALCAIFALSASSCSFTQQKIYHDGYYTAIASEFDEFGWKEFVTIYISKNSIVVVEYDAVNVSGLVKSWDMNYKRLMSKDFITYPDEFSRSYEADLVQYQSLDQVDVISGATNSHVYFKALVLAALENAKEGSVNTAYVDLPNLEEKHLDE